MFGGKPILELIVLALGTTLALPAFPQSAPEQRSADTSVNKVTAATRSSPEAPAPVRRLAEREFTETTLGLPLLKNVVLDQKAIWTSPGKLGWRDAQWLAPLGAATAALFATDHEVGKRLSNSPNRLRRSQDVSNFGLATLAGAGGGLYLWGRATDDDHRRETGLLSFEALLNTLVVGTSFQHVAGRQGPWFNGAGGDFFKGGTALPSDHAAAAWSLASVIAHEYPGPLTKFLAYGLATAVSASRVSAKEHFPSDVFIGGAVGWFIGRQVYRAHHNPELGGAAWGGRHESRDDVETGSSARSFGSPYVPLDSWVYAALDRLAALGYAHSALTGAKPWTRTECARLTEEAGESLDEAARLDRKPDDLALKFQAALKREFSYELGVRDSRPKGTFRVESLYTRALSISGSPLTDGFHFGQTISYDLGRPFRRGTNWIAGSAVSGSSGPFFFFVSGEYQHAPRAPALSDAVRNIIAARDSRALETARPFEPINRLTLLDSYVGMNFKNWQVSFGKQSLFWGAGESGGLLFSGNAEPLYMLRLTNATPLELPGVFGLFGPVRIEHFVAQPRGRSLVPRPYIYGQKIILKPVPYFEIGFSRTVTLGGRGGNPVTARNFLGSFFGLRYARGGSVPGDSRTAVDWTLRVPGLGGRLVFYTDSFADDDQLPLVNPYRSTWRPGLWLTRFPGVPKLDLRVEVTSSDLPGFANNQGGLNYFNGVYRDGYTNRGFLIGNTVGRQGTAVQAWSTYRFSPTSSLQFAFRNSTVDPDFIPGGGHWLDYSVRQEKYLESGFYVKSFLQIEQIRSYPILFNGSRSNVTASVEIGFIPERWRR